jgi:PAS domain S-box-containing protein
VTAVSATIGVSSLWLGGAAAPGAFGTMWLAWWTGDAIGILVVAPLLLAWAAGATQKVLVPVALESAVLVLVVVALAVILFGSDFQYAYPLFPVAMFAAYRLGARGAAVANVTVAVVVAFFTVRGLGPFVVATATAIESLFLFQVFVALLTITTLSSAAVLAERRRAEAELRLSEAHLAAAQSVAQLGSWRWDVAENRVVWSDELYRIYGLDRTTFQATLEAFLERVHPEDRERVAGAVGRALTERGAFQLDERIVRPDGAVRVLESRGTVLSGLDRGVVMIGVCQDVTEARRAQRTLAASESKFSTMFHASPVAICVIAMAKLEVVDANARFLEMLGSPRQAIVGRSPKDLGMWTEPGELRDVVARLRRQRSVRETPVRYVTREGQERRALAALELVEIDGQECALALLWRP